MMRAVDRLLPLLEGVRSVADDRWIGRCPAHADRTPSLSIRQTEDRVLVQDWAGCDAKAIVAAIGLALAELFDDALSTRRQPAPHSREMVTAAERLANLEGQLIESYALELRDQSLVAHADKVLAANPAKLLPGEREAAAKFVKQTRHRERQLHAALNILEFSPHHKRVEFLTGDLEQRGAMIGQILTDGGVADADGRFKWTAG
jgi:hypothetical protein